MTRGVADREHILTRWTADKVRWMDENRNLREKVRLAGKREELLAGRLAVLERRLASLTDKHEAALDQIAIRGESRANRGGASGTPKEGF